MGEFRFRTPVDWQLPDEVAATIHIVGLDGIPWPCKVAWTDDLLVVSRNREESGRTYLGYQSERFGRLMVCTGSLLANQDYDLMIELARGTLNRARNQISNWGEGGLEIGDQVHETVDAATRKLGTALMSDNLAQRDELAGNSLNETIEAVFELSEAFGTQVASYRRDHPEVEQFWMASTAPDSLVRPDDPMESKPEFQETPFNRIRISPEQATDCQVHAVSKPLIVGPFLDASAGGMSQSLIECDDFRARRLQVLNSMRSTLESLPEDVTMLHLVSGVNGLGHRHLNYAQQLQLTVDMLNLVDELSIQIPTMVSFDFPWAERLAGAVGGIHPLQVADSLLRQGVQISYLGLEMNLDYGSTGSAFRDPLQWIDLVDIWAQLGLPLVLCLRMPSGVDREMETDGQPNRLIRHPGSGMSDSQRQKMLETALPMMSARPMVAGLIWQQWKDDGDVRFPFGGLVAADGSDKPVLDTLRQLREQM
jgi:hypothetical protein